MQLTTKILSLLDRQFIIEKMKQQGYATHYYNLKFIGQVVYYRKDEAASVCNSLLRS